MKLELVKTIKQKLSVNDDQVITTSLDVAKLFKKEHKNILQAIMNLESPPEFNRLNFKPIKYEDSRGRQQPMISMTRDGFTLLAMGLTGPEAMRFKIAYLQAFNEMERLLADRGTLNALRNELFRHNRLWGKIWRYRIMGLSNPEIGKLTDRHRDTIRRNIIRMKHCGVLPSKRLALLRGGRS